ncbi:MAG: hypothetical protein PHG95_02840 [Patescibacteria group bacterium]|nr:hypothetical protein [Patescibacteria group bacterium]
MSHKELFQIDKTVYGDNYNEHLLEQYKLYVEGIEKISDRRHNANNYFITVNTAIITLIGLSFNVDFLKDNSWIRIVIALLGIIISVIFWYLIRAYKQLNTGKFTVIHKIEERMPLSLYSYEWDVLGNGKDNEKYYPFSHIELIIPRVFGILYFILGILFLLGCLK